MKVRILGFFCSLLLFATAKGQTIDGRLYTQFNSYYKWRGGGFDSTLLLPIVTAGSGKRAGAVRYNAADSSIYVWTGYQWRKAGNGDASTPTLAQVTAAGNSTTDSLNIVDDNGNRVAVFTKVPAGGSNRAGKLLLSASGLTYQTELSPTTLFFRNGSVHTSLAQRNNPAAQNNTISLPDSSGTLPLRVKLNSTTYSAANNGTVDLGTISVESSATLDFPSTNHHTNSDLTVTVTGAVLGDVVVLGVPNAAVEDHSNYTAWVSATDTVTVRFNNYGSGGAHNPNSGTFKIKLLK